MIRFFCNSAFWLCMACVVSLQVPIQAQERTSPPTTIGGAIDVAQCRVTLIDRVTLASARAGVAVFVEAREGDRVRARQVVARLDSTVAEASLAIAQQKASSTIERRMARNLVELSRAEYDKAIQANQKLEGGGVFADIEVRRLKLSVDKSGLQYEQAENEQLIHSLSAKQIEAELKTYSVESPFDGIVTRVHRSKGEAVSLGDPLVEVVNLSRVRVEGYVGIVEGLRIKQGTPVTVKLDLPDVDLPEERLEFPGKLVFVDVGVEPVTGQIRVWAEVLNSEGILRSGLPARMKIHSQAIAAK